MKKGKHKEVAQTLNDLTIPQRTFVTNITDPTTATFANFTQAFLSTGLKYGKNPSNQAIRMLANRNVLNVLCNWVNTKQENATVSAEINKEYVLQELREALIDCKSTGDMTNRIRVLELFGKYLDIWSNKLTVSIEQSPVLSVEDRKYLAELSRLHLATGTPQLIEACFNAVNSDIDVQDVVCEDNNTDHNCTDIDKCSNDNDLDVL
jgi:hypothetical protein